MLSPYLLDESNELTYEFITTSGIKYKIYFLDYSYMFAEYSNMIYPVFSLNIDAIDGNPEFSPLDKRIALTLSMIIHQFFEKIDHLLIYVCDSVDERHYARKRKFDNWFNEYNNGTLKKEDGIATIEGGKIYNSIIFHKDHPGLSDIIIAFNDLNTRSSEK